MKAENMDLVKNSLCVLPSENEGSADSHAGLIKAFNNLDLSDAECLLHLELKPEENKKAQCLLPVKCTLEASKDCVVNNDTVAEDYEKSESNMTGHVKNNAVVLTEIAKTTSPVNKGELVSSISSDKMNYIKSEEDLSTFFSELCLDTGSSCKVSCSVTGGSQDKSTSENWSSEKVHGPIFQGVNGVLLKKENANNSNQGKHLSENLLDDKLCQLSIPDVNDVFLKKEENSVDSFSKRDAVHFTSIKLEASSENEFAGSDNDDLGEDLLERGSTRKISNEERKGKKVLSGRTGKASENVLKQKKSFPTNLHMCGGLIVHGSPSKTLNVTSAYSNLVPFDNSSSCSIRSMESAVQASSSLPVFFDPNPINPVTQASHVNNSYSFPPSCESENFLDDVFSLPSVLSSSNTNNSGTSFMEVQNQSTVAQNERRKSAGNHQSTYDGLEDIFNYPSPVSEMSSYPGHSSRSTSPESGYCSSPRFSPFSDDGSEQYKDKQPSNSSTSLLDICSPPPCVPSEDEFIDNWDWSIFDDFESTSRGIQHTDEESKKIINVIKQDLKKCEEFCKANDLNTARKECNPLFTCIETPNPQNSHLCSDVNSSLVQGSSAQMHSPHQEQSSNVNIANQVPPAQINPTQVLLIYVPYPANGVPSATNGTYKGSKPFKPIEPDPEGQRLRARSPRRCLKEKLDRTKQMHYLYRITERYQNGDKNVIYVENTETRQTNLHLAVIKQDLELAYCLLEFHKQCSGDLAIVNCRDIYKKTALQYAVKNIMTVFVEYLKDYGAK